MKSATIFLVAVTMFTDLPHQSFAAPQLDSMIDNLGKIGGTVAGKALEGVMNSVGKVGETTMGMDNGDVGTMSDDEEASLDFENTAKHIDTVKANLAKVTGKLETLRGEAKATIEEAISKVAADLEQVESIVVKILKGAGEVGESVEELKVFLAQVEKTIKADLKEVVTVIDAILMKGGKDVPEIVPIVKSNVGQVTEDVDSIFSRLRKAFEALVPRTNGAVEITKEFTSLFAQLRENLNASIGRILKVLNTALATANGIQKEGLNNVEKFLEGLRRLSQLNITHGVISVNRNLLKHLKDIITGVVADIHSTVPKLLVNVGSSAVQGVLKEETDSIVNLAKPVVQAIGKLLFCQ